MCKLICGETIYKHILIPHSKKADKYQRYIELFALLVTRPVHGDIVRYIELKQKKNMLADRPILVSALKSVQLISVLRKHLVIGQLSFSFRHNRFFL